VAKHLKHTQLRKVFLVFKKKKKDSKKKSPVSIITPYNVKTPATPITYNVTFPFGTALLKKYQSLLNEFYRDFHRSTKYICVLIYKRLIPYISQNSIKSNQRGGTMQQ
jgi:hypothetical protein